MAERFTMTKVELGRVGSQADRGFKGREWGGKRKKRKKGRKEEKMKKEEKKEEKKKRRKKRRKEEKKKKRKKRKKKKRTRSGVWFAGIKNMEWWNMCKSICPWMEVAIAVALI